MVFPLASLPCPDPVGRAQQQLHQSCTPLSHPGVGPGGSEGTQHMVSQQHWSVALATWYMSPKRCGFGCSINGLIVPALRGLSVDVKPIKCTQEAISVSPSPSVVRA